MVIGVLLLASAAGVYWSVSHRTPAIANYPSGGSDVIALGDSLVAGTGATEGRDLVSDLSRDIGAPIVNLGVSGDTTADGLARLAQLDQYHPKVVIVLLGGND